MKTIIALFTILFAFVQPVYGQSYQQQASEMFTYMCDEETDITENAKDIIENGFDFSLRNVIDKCTDLFASEIKTQGNILKKIAIISILCGFFTNIGEAFGKKEVSEIGFFVCLISIIYMVLDTVSIQCAYVYDAVEKISIDFKIALPVFVAAASASGRAVSSPFMFSLMMAFTAFIMFFTKNIAVPFISAVALLECVNCMSQKEILNSLCILLKKIVSVALRISAFVFTFVLSLQRIGTGQMSSLIFKTTKNAVGAVPIVGDIMKSSAETVTAVSSMINNSLAVAAAVMVFTVCSVAVMKLCIMWLIYKVAAAFLEPVTDKRITKALNSAGDISSTLMAVLFTVSISYVVCVFVILLSFG